MEVLVCDGLTFSGDQKMGKIISDDTFRAWRDGWVRAMRAVGDYALWAHQLHDDSGRMYHWHDDSVCGVIVGANSVSGEDMREWKSEPTSEGYWWMRLGSSRDPVMYFVTMGWSRQQRVWDFDRARVYSLGSESSWTGRLFKEEWPSGLYQKAAKWED